VGPWILWKIRDIQDVHSWAWQTRLAIIAGYVQIGLLAVHVTYALFSLPGTPLWIAFTYSNMESVKSITRFFAPAGW
jgi:hypothetical protein